MKYHVIIEGDTRTIGKSDTASVAAFVSFPEVPVARRQYFSSLKKATEWMMEVLKNEKR